MEDLPLIPGYTIRNPLIQDYKLKSKLDFRNGYRVLRDSNIGIGRRPVDSASCAFSGEPDIIQYDPSLTYGRVKEYGYQQVVPHYALFAQKCLCFKAYFRQSVPNSPDEYFRIRHVNIVYFLEDDTMSVMEPSVDNSGLRHGRVVRRGKIEKNSKGDKYHWKDLNVGIDIGIYGVVYHTVHCDTFTREFLTSQGIDVSDNEELPQDPYTEYRRSQSRAPAPVHATPVDARRKFLEYDSMILKFDATWNDDAYQILYFLTDDTVAVREIHKLNDGKDPASMLLKRTRVPKNWKDLPSTYPAIYMEISDAEVTEYYTPRDLRVGETISIYGRPFLLLDCDAFTRKYYSSMLGVVQPGAISRRSEEDDARHPPQRKVIPPHSPFGSPEDTLAGCLSLVPKPPRKDVVRQLFNFPKKLRYSMRMDAVHPEDEGRDFILQYNLSDGMILIAEPEKRNSGRRDGTFLSSMFVPKPGTNRDDPDYYTPEDFFIGAKINVFNHRFTINGADLHVYRYIEANPEKFSDSLRDNMRNHFVGQGLLQGDASAEVCRTDDGSEARHELDSKIGESRSDELDTRMCVEALNIEAHRRYDGPQRGSRTPTPIPEEQRSGLTNTDEPLRMDLYRGLDQEKLMAQERKEIKWADQIDTDTSGHPVVSCHPELPDCTTFIPRDNESPRHFNDRGRKFEVDQLHQTSRNPRKFESIEPVSLIQRNTGGSTVTMLRDKGRNLYRQ